MAPMPYKETALQRFARVTFLPKVEKWFDSAPMTPVYVGLPFAAIGLFVSVWSQSPALIVVVLALLAACSAYMGLLKMARDEDDRYFDYTTLVGMYEAREVYRSYWNGEISYEEYDRRLTALTGVPDDEAETAEDDYVDDMAQTADELVNMSDDEFEAWLRYARLRG